MALNLNTNGAHTPAHQAGSAPIHQNQAPAQINGRALAQNNGPAAPRQQTGGFRQTIRSLFGRSQTEQAAPQRSNTPAATQALLTQSNLNAALKGLLAGNTGASQKLSLALQTLGQTLADPTSALSLGDFVSSALASLPKNQLPDLVQQLHLLNDNGELPGNLAETLINEATEMAHATLKTSAHEQQQALQKLTDVLAAAGTTPLPQKTRDSIAGALRDIWNPIAKTQATLAKLHVPLGGTGAQFESSGVAALLKDGLSSTQLKTVLSCAALDDLMRLINETGPNDPLHHSFKTELKARETKDLQSFQTIVAQLKADDLDLPHSLTDAPVLSNTVVEMTEVWLRLQAYETADPTFTLNAQAKQDHQDMVKYLSTQTQADTLAADDLSDAQLGQLNSALKKFIPKNQQSTSLAGFKAVFDKEFQSRLDEKASHTKGAWMSLMHQTDVPASQLMPDLVNLMRTRKAVAESAGAMLMDGGRHASQASLNQALADVVASLPPNQRLSMMQHWTQDNTINELSDSAQQLALSDEEMALLEHTINELPNLMLQALHGLAPDGQTRVRPTGDSLDAYQANLEGPLSAKESADSTEVTLAISHPQTATIELPVSRSFIVDAMRGFAHVQVDGNNVFDVSNWKTLSNAVKEQRVQAGLQALFVACGQQPAALLKVTQFLHQGVAAAARVAMASGIPFIKTTNGLGVQACQESAHQASFELTTKGNGRFDVCYQHEYEVAAITTDTGARVELDRHGNSLKTSVLFELDIASDRLSMQGQPIFDFQLQPAFNRPYPIPVATDIVSTNSPFLTLLSSANLGSNQPLADDLHAFAQAQKGKLIGDANHKNATADGLVRAWDFFAQSQGEPDLTALRHCRDMLLNPQAITYIGIEAAQAQVFSQAITKAETDLVNAFAPIVSDCMLNLNGAFGQGHFTKHQWSFGSFTGTYTDFLTKASPADLQVFRQWAMSPVGCPESLAFMDAMAELKHNPDETLAQAIFQRFTMAPASTPGLFVSTTQAPPGTYHLNVKGTDYAKALAAVNAAVTARQQLSNALRNTVEQIMDTTLLPAFIAHAAEL
ncbi:hypothetical protein [Lampropedia aestuarii]|uniref:hypothetical protein n=1 Tax=Lampropedia aestuarii TaxID=2562762 RepID=UPI002469253B|nr:hypothetical protein [Lampropedia aestuarii]MDH5857322.1 hypothetical protein [Lampropedia aestuarii]